MPAAPLHESSRLELLHSLDVLDTGSEPAFDALVRTASLVCQCPISLISLIDTDRQWFKAGVGLAARETPRSQAFCAHAIRTDDLFEVPDAAADARFAGNPLVRGDPNIRFYAGQPLVYDGVALGTICVIDRTPRTLTIDQRLVLQQLAVVTVELLRGRLEARLHRRETDRLVDFARLSGDWFWETDVLHRCTWISGDAEQAAGLFPRRILNERFRELAIGGGADPSGEDPSLLTLLDAGRPFNDVTVRTTSADGPAYIAVSATPLVDAAGRVIGHRGSARDISDRIRLEISVRERSGVLRKIAGQVPGMLYQYRSFADGRGCFPYSSEGIRDLYEVAPDDVRDDAARVLARVHEDDVDDVRASIDVSRANGTIWHARYRVRLPVKGVRWLQGCASPERLADGSTLWHGYIADVTESHARDRQLGDAHQALQAGARRLRAITDHLPALITHVDRDQRYTFANAHVGRVFGGDEQRMIGATMLDVRGPTIYAQIGPHVEAALSGRTVSFEGEGEVAGRRYTYQSDYVPDVDENGNVVGFFAMTFDITERKDAELRQAASERLLRGITDHLPALVAHVGIDNRYRFANAAYRTWFGFDPLAMVGRSVDEFFDEATCAAIRPFVDRARAGERTSFERRSQVAGTDRHFLVDYVPDVGEDGVVHGVYAMTTDITARRNAELRLAASEKLLLDVTNNIPAVIGQFDMDERCVFANDVGLKAHGLTRADMDGLTFGSHIPRELYEQHAPALRDVLAGRRSVVHGQRTMNGKPCWFKAHLVPQHDAEGTQRGFFVMTFDVTTLKTADLARVASEQRLRDITDNLPVLVSYVDRDERFAYVNETFRSFIGDASRPLIGQTVLEAVGPELYEQRRLYIRRCLAGERLTFDMQSVAQGDTKYLQTTYLPDVAHDGRVMGMTTLSVDVTDLKAAQHRLSQLAHFDDLTGLPNRLQFNQQLAATLARPTNHGRTTALMFLDIDHFKQINDTHGHAIGDSALKHFAARIRHGVRSTDFVARLGGDEFVVILHDIGGIAEAQAVARKVVANVGRPFVVDGATLTITTSVGVGMRDPAGDHVAQLLAKADKALYLAKEAGRNTFRLAA